MDPFVLSSGADAPDSAPRLVSKPSKPNDSVAMLLASEPPAMEVYRVSRAVNTPRNNREDLLAAVA